MQNSNRGSLLFFFRNNLKQSIFNAVWLGVCAFSYPNYVFIIRLIVKIINADDCNSDLSVPTTVADMHHKPVRLNQIGIGGEILLPLKQQ